MQTREELQKILDNMTDGVALVSPDLRMEFANDRLMEFQQYPADVVYPGASMRDIARFQAERGDFGAVDDIEAAIEHQMELLTNPSGARYERFAVSKRYIEINFHALDDGSILIVHRDITELKNRETALEASRADAEADAPDDADRARQHERRRHAVRQGLQGRSSSTSAHRHFQRFPRTSPTRALPATT